MKFLSLSDAVRAFVHDGGTLVLEGFTYLIPSAAGHDIIWQGCRDLTLIRMTPDIIYRDAVDVREPSTAEQLAVLRDLKACTEAVHIGAN
jgi:acyl CoA:acetate/3-ketoacid CoA transferase alpha subunit